MRKKMFIAAFLFLFCSLIAFGQNKPQWVNSFESKFVQKEPDWKIKKDFEAVSQNGIYNYSFTLTANTKQARIEINKLPETPNRVKNAVENLFASGVTMIDGRLDKYVEKIRLEDFGDEGFVWANYNKDGWTKIKFRKQDIFITVDATSEETARKFARYVFEEMP